MLAAQSCIYTSQVVFYNFCPYVPGFSKKSITQIFNFFCESPFCSNSSTTRIIDFLSTNNAGRELLVGLPIASAGARAGKLKTVAVSTAQGKKQEKAQVGLFTMQIHISKFKKKVSKRQIFIVFCDLLKINGRFVN